MMEIFDRGVPLRRGQAHVRWIDQLMPIVTDDSDPLGVQQLATHRLPSTTPRADTGSSATRPTAASRWY
jgi:hypothetical protein